MTLSSPKYELQLWGNDHSLGFQAQFWLKSNNTLTVCPSLTHRNRLVQGPAHQGSDGRSSRPVVVIPFPVLYQPRATARGRDPSIVDPRKADSCAAALTVNLA